MEKENSYIEKFTSLYGASANEIKFLTQKQKKEFGFTIFILFRENIDRAIKLGIKNSKNIIDLIIGFFLFPITNFGFCYIVGNILDTFKIINLFLLI